VEYLTKYANYDIFTSELNVDNTTKGADIMQQHITKVGIIGAGFMGLQIAWYFATKGISVDLIDIDREALDKSDSIFKGFATQFGKAEDALPNIHIYCTEDIIRPGVFYNHYGLVIDCTPEQPAIKRALFDSLEQFTGILATNSSFMPVASLESGKTPSQRMCNMHFLPPVWQRPLVEVARGTQTTKETIELVVAFCQSVDLTPIVLQNPNPGFVFGVLWEAIKETALDLADREIASIADIDTAWVTATGMDAGPFRVMDMVGLDLVATLLQMHGKPVPVVLKSLIDDGHLGQKSGRGFYSYESQQ
jgi:3-hydroxybutyryl-CoA dehydrogenase